jgi:hypothetical protein
MSAPILANNQCNTSIAFSSGVLTLTAGTVPTAGNAMLVIFGVQASNGHVVSSVTDNQTGNTFTKQFGGYYSTYNAGSEYWLCQSLATLTTPATYTVTLTMSGNPSSSTGAMALLEVAGSTGIESNGAISLVSTSPNDPTCTAANTVATDLVITSITGPSGFSGFTSSGTCSTQVCGLTGGNPGLCIYQGATSSIVTPAQAFTYSNSASSAAGIIAFKGLITYPAPPRKVRRQIFTTYYPA